MKPRMRDQIKELERSLRAEQGCIGSLQTQLKAANQRVTDLAAENESLRMDKKWLQQRHSQLLQQTTEIMRTKRP